MTELAKTEAKDVAVSTPHELDIHTEKLTSLVNNITASALDGHRRIDEANKSVIKSINNKQGSLLDQIDEYRQMANHALDAVKIVEEALSQMQDTFEVSLPRVAKLPGKPARNGGSQ